MGCRVWGAGLKVSGDVTVWVSWDLVRTEEQGRDLAPHHVTCVTCLQPCVCAEGGRGAQGRKGFLGSPVRMTVDFDGYLS